MLLKRDDIKDVCSKILAAVDTNGLSTITESLEIIVHDGILYLNVLGAKEIRNVLRAKSAEKKAKENEKSRKNKKVGKREKH